MTPVAVSPTVRCPWAGNDPIYVAYHDHEWGVPVVDDRSLFEFLVLEGAQAGLSWLTILRKRDHFRRGFLGFDPEAVARFDDRRIDRLMTDPGIVRNRLKLAAAVNNAKRLLDVKAQYGDFSSYIWSFTGGRVIQNAWETMDQVPTETDISRGMSIDLKNRGFRFVGPTICYAYMQAVGMVNDHLVRCFRHGEIRLIGTGAGVAADPSDG
jgi:DNA-3-methyladenine glycosylase I